MKLSIFLLCLCLFIVNCADSPPVTITREATRINQVVVTRIVTRPPSLMCRQLGCGYGLAIRLEGAKPLDFSIFVEYEKSGELTMESRQCINGFWDSMDILCDLFLMKGAPQRFQLTAFWKGEELTSEYRPAFEEYRPNGPGCEPVCKRAMVSFTFPDPG